MVSNEDYKFYQDSVIRGAVASIDGPITTDLLVQQWFHLMYNLYQTKMITLEDYNFIPNPFTPKNNEVH